MDLYMILEKAYHIRSGHYLFFIRDQGKLWCFLTYLFACYQTKMMLIFVSRLSKLF